MDALPDERFHAIVVDEGQDFERGWLETLDLLLVAPGEDLLWVFHDPGQALFRDDRVGELRFARLDLFENLRNPGPVSALADRFYRGGESVAGVRENGVPVRIVEAAPGREALEALRKELHRLMVEEQVAPSDLAVLSGTSAEKSEVWRKRRFGNVTLWNEALGEAGHKGLPPEEVPEEPPNVVLFETIRRFKGLERPAIVLVELPERLDQLRLDELLYVALTRATTSLTVIAPPALAQRLSED
jgi:superfamily I DNA/RNA helicase